MFSVCYLRFEYIQTTNTLIKPFRNFPKYNFGAITVQLMSDELIIPNRSNTDDIMSKFQEA